MEQLNRIELRGRVGSVRVQEVSGRKVAHVTVATDFAYKDRSGNAVIETTWHNVTAWEGRDICPLGEIVRGQSLAVTGRIRNQKYTGADGTERYGTEVIASSMSPLGEDPTVPCRS